MVLPGVGGACEDGATCDFKSTLKTGKKMLDRARRSLWSIAFYYWTCVAAPYLVFDDPAMNQLLAAQHVDGPAHQKCFY